MATTPNTNHSGYLKGSRTGAENHQGQQALGHGHATPLDTRPGPTTAVPSYLGPRKTQQS